MSIRETDISKVEVGSVWKILRENKADARYPSGEGNNENFYVAELDNNFVYFGREPGSARFDWGNERFLKGFVRVPENKFLKIQLAAILNLSKGIIEDSQYIQDMLIELDI